MNPNRPNFDWNDLRSFLAIVRTGRLTVAASQLGIDHSTLSRRITSLETALQVRLFDRLLTGYALTDHGRILVGEAEEIESVAIRISSNIEDAKARMIGPVRIATPEGFGTYFVAHRLRDLSQEHPGITLELIADPSIVSLTKRQADIAVTMERPVTGPLRAQKLTDYEYGLYGVDHLLSSQTDSEINLSNFKLIGYISDMLPTASHDYFREIFGERLADMSTSNILTQIAATISGHGLCILPCFMAAKHTSLRRVLAKQICFNRSYWLTTHVDARAPARAKVIASFLQEGVKTYRDAFLPSLKK
ncbi:LysR family transcriptional regulator [Lichenibacterium minor]|uniref:LysR family transcriptional regulator n=1 Tax=Lichenibacterium minor TaxID=2316528 RepID=A0A4Q2U1K7_9HYPH|nr:LysR family transcriptional regulator [Lichenibacterium minor]RYC30172.1 LysR family transcriptional regulator [Lichenibacterium minor]